jgi:hypothetical protein
MMVGDLEGGVQRQPLAGDDAHVQAVRLTGAAAEAPDVVSREFDTGCGRVRVPLGRYGLRGKIGSGQRHARTIPAAPSR